MKIGDVRLIKVDLPDKMKAFTRPGNDLIKVLEDFHGYQLIALKGDWTKGVLQVDQFNRGVGYWMNEDEWNTIRPGAVIQIDGQQFVRVDNEYRIRQLAAGTSKLEVVSSNWHGYTLMAQDGDIREGLLMVTSEGNGIGLWVPMSEADAARRQR
jgi:hypothetical protein